MNKRLTDQLFPVSQSAAVHSGRLLALHSRANANAKGESVCERVGPADDAVPGQVTQLDELMAPSAGQNL